jgi:hypothetical protein
MLAGRLSRPWTWIVVACGFACCVVAVGAGAADQPADARVRVGTYDARAVAVAYAPSALHDRQLKAKMQEMKDAETRGDKNRVKELRA